MMLLLQQMQEQRLMVETLKCQLASNYMNALTWNFLAGGPSIGTRVRIRDLNEKSSGNYDPLCFDVRVCVCECVCD